MGCDALNVGAYDLSLGIDYLLTLRKTAHFPLLSANLTDRNGTLLFDPYLIRTIDGVRVGIFGLLDTQLKLDKIPGGDALRVSEPEAVAAEITARLKQEGAEFIVLLTNMEGRPLRGLTQSHLPIDLIVGSDKRNQISLPMVTQDTFVTHLDRGGRSVGHLEVEPLPKATGTTGRGESIRGRLFRHQFVQLRLDIPDDPRVEARVVAFETHEATLQKEQLAGNGGDDDCGSTFVGIDRCATCHADRYRTWQTTDHAHALATLTARNRQYDEECLACHVLAYECDKGSLKIANVEQFANVQCESCHGPGDLHVASGGEEPTRPLQSVEEICLRCHTPERSDEMDFAAVAKRICARSSP
ncbi:MAG: multiheme c-type cytochrome [Deferrisomatales bacterium]|nr:multiheme c-type cytochrome [Deferrisomatales bacterium]